ncbi:NAD(P)-dependent oxidoreductase [Levilactobacillus zymae]|uniref:NAD(P)-dependent oxidoreductase n=1 Tax=Levilactobacillus zymae TaxID=267363 RepID=UPI0028B4C7B2|nr:NAD(P)-dependent oxidoreductase [Levilactobacillus zymae]MDT6980193.1 NAD(P)-dependent oxidoreductase [Levilactobacillus zymae]
MTERILALQSLTADHLAALRADGLDVVTAADYQPGGAPVTILYGWDDDLGPAVINDEHNQIHWLQTLSAGIDYLPLDLIRDHHIKLTNSSGVFSDAIAESTMGYLLYFLRGFNEAVKNQAGHFWIQPARPDLHNLSDQTVVIYGTGSIGQAMAKRLNGFDNAPIGVNRSGHPVDGFAKTVSLAEDATVLGDADIVINAMPATPETNHYFNAAFFKQLNGLRIFVNVGRGTAVDLAALEDALLYQEVLHAALDVFETEPFPKDAKLWDFPNVLLTPHQTGFSDNNLTRTFEIFRKNLTSYLQDGTLVQNIADPLRGY